ncbi:MAG: hypothetical protein KGI89_07635 [Euryarchaeota archaeon]|nr:hypothetical protein [Euryarchaeota archaeon]
MAGSSSTPETSMGLSLSAGTLGRGAAARSDRVRVPMTLLQLGQSLSTRSMEELEQTYRKLTPPRLRSIFSAHPEVAELSCLRSCHRVEVYAVIRDGSAGERLRRSLPGPLGRWELRKGSDAAHHLFRVAAGLESMAVGEHEVRHQVAEAARTTLSRHGRPLLRSMMDASVRSAGTSATPGDRDPPSIAALVVRKLLDRAPQPSTRVLVLGTGTVGRKVADLLRGKAHVTLAYHRRAPDPAVLEHLGCLAVRFADVPKELRHTEVLIAAAKGGEYAIRTSDLPRAPRGPLRLIFDLGLPRNVDPSLANDPRVELFDLAGLRSEAPTPPGPTPADRAARVASDLAFRLYLSGAWEPVLSELWRKAERIRQEELEGALLHAPELSSQEREVLSKLTERLVRRLLSGPTARLRTLTEGDLKPEVVAAVLALFDEADVAP